MFNESDVINALEKGGSVGHLSEKELTDHLLADFVENLLPSEARHMILVLMQNGFKSDFEDRIQHLVIDENED